MAHFDHLIFGLICISPSVMIRNVILGDKMKDFNVEIVREFKKGYKCTCSSGAVGLESWRGGLKYLTKW